MASGHVSENALGNVQEQLLRVGEGRARERV